MILCIIKVFFSSSFLARFYFKTLHFKHIDYGYEMWGQQVAFTSENIQPNFVFDVIVQRLLCSRLKYIHFYNTLLYKMEIGFVSTVKELEQMWP